MRGLKEVRDFRKPDASTPPGTAAQVAAATILENVTLSEWSASNRDARAGMDRLCDILLKVRDELVELRHEISEARHDIREGR